MSAESLMAGGLGAAPLALLTDDAAPRLAEMVSRFADRVDREAPAPADASLLLSCAFILLGLRYDKAVGRALSEGVQKMRESSTYLASREERREEGLTKGMVLGRQEALLAVLHERFPVVPPEVEARIRASTDLDRLQAAIRQALHINSPAELSL
jgi:hypothetical protein